MRQNVPERLIQIAPKDSDSTTKSVDWYVDEFYRRIAEKRHEISGVVISLSTWTQISVDFSRLQPLATRRLVDVER